MTCIVHRAIGGERWIVDMTRHTNGNVYCSESTTWLHSKEGWGNITHAHTKRSKHNNNDNQKCFSFSSSGSSIIKRQQWKWRANDENCGCNWTHNTRHTLVVWHLWLETLTHTLQTLTSSISDCKWMEWFQQRRRTAETYQPTAIKQ